MQPDFHALWSSYFNGVPRKVTYKVRQDANCRHDIVFLSSLIHDARFRLDDVRLSRARLTMPLARDCWELPFHDLSKRRAELYQAQARLTISQVLKMEWRFDHPFDEGLEISKTDELWIDTVSLDRPPFEPDVLTLYGHAWQLIITFRDDDFSVRLQDLEMPYLPSERKKANRLAARRRSSPQKGRRSS